MSANLAIGASILLVAGGLLRRKRDTRGSANDDLRAPKAVSGQERARGRADRAILRALERGPQARAAIIQRTGLSDEELSERLADLLRRRSVYLNARGLVGKSSGFHDDLLWILNNKEIGDDAAIRAVGLILYVLPGTPLRPGAHTMVTLRSPEELLGDVREYLGADKDMSSLRGLFRDYVRDRRILDLLLLDDQVEDKLFDIEDAGRRWGGSGTIPWFASAVSTLMRSPWSLAQARIDYLIGGRLGYIYDWILSTPRPRISGLSFEAAEEGSQRWHEQRRDAAAAAQVARKKKSGAWFDCPDGVHPIRSDVMLKDRSGLFWVELTTWDELQNEGNISKGGGCLKHCIGDGSSYMSDASAGESRHFSLRAPGNRPLMTLTIAGLGLGRPYVSQAKGFRNRQVGGVDAGNSVSHALSAVRDGGLLIQSAEEYGHVEALAIKALLDHLRMPSLMDGTELRLARETLAKAARSRPQR